MNNYRKTCTIDDLRNNYPVLSAQVPHASRSEKYTMVPTIEIVSELMGKGFVPVQVGQQRVRKEHRQGFQKHMVRMTDPHIVTGEEAMDILIYNSHDGTTGYKVMGGIYRFVCANGLVLGDTVASISLRHMGCTPDDVVDASFRVINQAELVIGDMNEMKNILLSPEQRNVFAITASEMLYDENVRPKPEELLMVPRHEDVRPTLWNTYNTVQENWSKGRTMYRDKKGNWRKNRAPAAVDKDIRLNQALHSLAMRMAELVK